MSYWNGKRFDGVGVIFCVKKEICQWGDNRKKLELRFLGSDLSNILDERKEKLFFLCRVKSEQQVNVQSKLVFLMISWYRIVRCCKKGLVLSMYEKEFSRNV